MIIIDEQTDAKLIKALEAWCDEPDAARYVYFKLAKHPPIEGIKQKVIDAARQHIDTANPQIFLCEDGDIFILAPTIAVKDAKAFLLDVAAYAKLPVSDDFVSFNELSLHINTILHMLENKLDKKRKLAEARAKQLEEEALARKRKNILNSAVNSTAEEIATKRNSRAAPEFMIIEDDVFSSRLVEKVLEKKYALTALHSAEEALATYSRLAPDLLFLDINLPDVTGHELLEKILKLDPAAYVIMISGNADRENITQAMQHGAKGFIAKPFNRDRIFQYIERCPTIH